MNSNSVTVITFGDTSYTTLTDGSNQGVLGAGLPGTQNYTVASNGKLTVPTSGGVVGYVASACTVENILSGSVGPTLGTAECQNAPTTNITLSAVIVGDGHLSSQPPGILCPDLFGAIRAGNPSAADHYGRSRLHIFYDQHQLRADQPANQSADVYGDHERRANRNRDFCHRYFSDHGDQGRDRNRNGNQRTGGN